MKVLFDTSVLIAAVLADHQSNRDAVRWLTQAKRRGIGYCVSAHTLAEMYSVLTRLPLSHRVSPEQAARLIQENVLRHAQVVALKPRDYRQLISEVASQRLVSGQVFDAIIVKAAEAANVDYLLTMNTRHFALIWKGNEHRLISPDSAVPV